MEIMATDLQIYLLLGVAAASWLPSTRLRLCTPLKAHLHLTLVCFYVHFFFLFSIAIL